MSAYIKRISDGVIIHSCSSQSVSTPAQLASMQEFLTSRGMSLVDYIIADGTEAEIKAMIASAKTPRELWEKQMMVSDAKLPRWAEDLYDTLPQLSKDGSAPALQSKVAQKKLLRQSKPI